MCAPKRLLRKAYVHASRCLACMAAMVVLYCEVTGSRQTRSMLVGISTDAEATNVYRSPNIAEFLSTLVQFREEVGASLAALIPPDDADKPLMVYLDRSNETNAVEARTDVCTETTSADYLYELQFAHPTLQNAMADVGWNVSGSYIVVDCGFDGRLESDTSTFKVHLLDKQLTTFTTFFIQTLNLELHRQHRSTSGGVAIWTTTPLSVMTAAADSDNQPTVESAEEATYFATLSSTFPYDAGDFHLVTLDSLVPATGQWTGRMDATGDVVSFGGTEGIYRGSPHIQANVDFYHWMLPPSPIAYAHSVEYVNSHRFKDSWGWFRCFLGIGIGSNLIVNAVVAVLVMINLYRRDGTVWLPDIYPAIQRRATIRASLLLLDCVMGSWWYAHQSCMNQGNYRTERVGTLALENMTRADGIMVCLAISFIVADFVGVRVQLAAVVAIYMVCFLNRLDLVSSFGIRVTKTNEFLANNYDDNIIPGNGGMDLWAMHENTQTNYLLIATECTWLLAATGCSVAYVLAAWVWSSARGRQVWAGAPAVQPTPGRPRHRRQSFLRTLVQSDRRPSRYRTTHWTRRSTLYEELGGDDLADNTAFERSVGRIASDEFGFVAATKDYVRKNNSDKQLFVSPSGVWLLGFVVVNDEFVVGINQYLFLVVNVLLQRRLFRIYALSLAGDVVSKRKHRLFYYDLTRITVWNVSLKPLR